MKISLPLKLAIAVVIIFGVTIAACLLYKPLKIRWYESKLDSEDVGERRQAVEKLLALGDGGKAVIEENVIGKDSDWIISKFGKPTLLCIWEKEEDGYSIHVPEVSNLDEYTFWVYIYGSFILWLDDKALISKVIPNEIPEYVEEQMKAEEAERKKEEGYRN
ncbi:MAG: hypothetical protein ACYS8W_17285 [Planctomycetota bacterium]|jgi:hypothetical protein